MRNACGAYSFTSCCVLPISFFYVNCRGSLDKTPQGHGGDLGNETRLLSVIFNGIQWDSMAL